MSRKIISSTQKFLPILVGSAVELHCPLTTSTTKHLLSKGLKTLAMTSATDQYECKNYLPLRPVSVVLPHHTTPVLSSCCSRLTFSLPPSEHIGSLSSHHYHSYRAPCHCHCMGLSEKHYSEIICDRQTHRLEHHRHLRTNSKCVCNTMQRQMDLHRRHFSLTPKAILDASPLSVQPYLRLIRFDKPIGTWLLYWPCTWSIAMAAEAGHLPDLGLLALFGAGAFLMRGSGCIINDMWDQDIDKKVERTKVRPLASGELTPFQGLVFLGGNLSLALLVLLQLNTYSIILGAGSMLLVVLYPLAKRYTYWPQLMLGVTLNWGVLLAWSALRGGLEWPVIPVYAACVLYTMFYDTIYSHQDKYDDMLIGVKSTALKLGDQTKPWLAGFSSLMISGLTLTGYLCDQTWPYYTGVAITAAHLAHQLYTVDLNNADDCAAKFRSNSTLGVVMFLGTVMGTLLKKSASTETSEDEVEATDT